MPTLVKDRKRTSLSQIWRTYQRALFGLNAGNTGSLYANPHAVTSITPTSTTTPSSSFTYDKNGNLTLSSGTATTTYSWNYSNLLASTTTNNITERYSYDNGGQRVKVTDGSTNHTTLYPSKQYNADYDNGGTLSKQTSHSFGGDVVLATLETKNLITTNSLYSIVGDYSTSHRILLEVGQIF